MEKYLKIPSAWDCLDRRVQWSSWSSRRWISWGRQRRSGGRRTERKGLAARFYSGNSTKSKRSNSSKSAVQIISSFMILTLRMIKLGKNLSGRIIENCLAMCHFIEGFDCVVDSDQTGIEGRHIGKIEGIVTEGCSTTVTNRIVCTRLLTGSRTHGVRVRHSSLQRVFEKKFWSENWSACQLF